MMDKPTKKRNKMNKNTPIKPGLYWGKRDSSDEWHNLIIETYGKPPFLKWKYWDRIKDAIVEGSGTPEFHFGDEIIDPEAKN